MAFEVALERRALAGTRVAAAKYGFPPGMSSAFAHSHFMPCDECGASLAADERDGHVCDPERRLEYRLVQLRYDVAGFEDDLRGYLDSPQGKFAQWLAEHNRRRPPP